MHYIVKVIQVGGGGGFVEKKPDGVILEQRLESLNIPRLVAFLNPLSGIPVGPVVAELSSGAIASIASMMKANIKELKAKPRAKRR